MLLTNLIMVLAVAYVGYIVHMVVVYSLTIKTLGGVSPMKFFKEMMPAMMMAFSSASSVGTLPFTMEAAERLGARREVAGFVLPLGSTINMDGTAIYQGVCAVFIAACYGVDLTLGQMITIVLTATLASIGTAGVSRRWSGYAGNGTRKRWPACGWYRSGCWLRPYLRHGSYHR